METGMAGGGRFDGSSVALFDVDGPRRFLLFRTEGRTERERKRE